MEHLKFKVVHIVPKMDVGGVEETTKATIEELHARGIPVLLVSYGGKLANYLKTRGVQCFTLPVHSKNPIVQLLNIFLIYSIIKRENATIIHCHSRAPAWSAYFASIIAKCKLITTFHSYYAHKHIKYYYSRIMTMGDRIITPSSALRNHIIKTYGVNSDTIALLPHFVNKTAHPTRSSTNEFKIKYKIPNDARILAVVSRPSRWKGLEIAIEALKILSHINIVLLVVGQSDGMYANNSARAYPKNEFDKQIISIKGSRSNIEHAYTISDCALSLSSTKPEGFGMTILEALSFGLPVIASNHGGALDLVKHETNGYLFEPNNALDLSKKILMMLNLNFDQNIAMRSACKRHASKFNSEEIIPRLLDIYKNVSEHE